MSTQKSYIEAAKKLEQVSRDRRNSGGLVSQKSPLTTAKSRVGYRINPTFGDHTPSASARTFGADITAAGQSNLQTPHNTATPAGASPPTGNFSRFSTYDVSRVENTGGSPGRFTFSSMSSPAVRNTTSVIAAFRELQAKAKAIESERIAAVRERDDLQRQLDDLKKNSHLWHSQAEIEARNNLLNMRAASEMARTRTSELELKYMSLDDENKSIQRSIALHREHARSLEQEVLAMNADSSRIQNENSQLRKDIEHIELRCAKVHKEAIRSPERHQKQQDRISDALDDVTKEIDYVRASTDRTRLRCEAMQRYMEMLLNINGDLCRKMVGIFDTKDGVKSIAKAFSPPRYQWPKVCLCVCRYTVVCMYTMYALHNRHFASRALQRNVADRVRRC
jgi:hypothetical protein